MHVRSNPYQLSVGQDRTERSDQIARIPCWNLKGKIHNGNVTELLKRRRREVESDASLVGLIGVVGCRTRMNVRQAVMHLHDNARAFRKPDPGSYWKDVGRSPRSPCAEYPGANKKTWSAETRVSRARLRIVECRRLIEFVGKQQNVMNDRAIRRQHLIAANV